MRRIPFKAILPIGSLLAVVVLAVALSTASFEEINSEPGNALAPASIDVSQTIGDGAGNPAHLVGVQSEYVTGLEQLPASLRGTELDGGFYWDEHNELIIMESIRDLFDYFLAASGEEPLASLVARMRAYISSTLPEPAASQAQNLLQNYLEMKAALVALDEPEQPRDGDDLVAMRNHVQNLQALRNSYLSPEVATVFYAESDEYDHYMLERLAIEKNSTLSAQEKERRLAHLVNSLSPDLQQSLTATQQLVKLSRVNQQARDSGIGDASLLAMRGELLGNEAAERLQTLDQERRTWSGRMSSWLQERAQLLNSDGLDLLDRQRQVSQRRHQHFTAREMRRVLALESIHSQSN